MKKTSLLLMLSALMLLVACSPECHSVCAVKVKQNKKVRHTNRAPIKHNKKPSDSLI